MQKALGYYLQITGGILGGLLLVAMALWAVKGHLPGNGWPSQEIQTGNAGTDEREQLGWIAREGSEQSLGLGLLVGEQTVLSAGHVMTAGGELKFYRPGAPGQKLTLMAHDTDHDLAAAKIQAQKVVFPVKVAAEVTAGEPVYMWLYQDGAWARADGLVREASASVQLYQTWGEVLSEGVAVVSVVMDNNLGDSGAAVWNAEHELVGILVGVDLEDLQVSYVMRVQEQWLDEQ